MIPSKDGKEKAADLLVLLRSRGIKIWSDNGRLRYQAPKGSLTQDDMERLGAVKADLIEMLQRASSNEDVGQQITRRLPSEPIPLTFSQQLWWNSLQLGKHPSMRSVAGALRLTGPLNVDCMRECFSELVRRHESLRTRIVVADGVPRQVIEGPIGYELQSFDLSRSSNDEQSEGIRRLFERIAHELFSVATGPLFAASLIKLRDEEHVLLVAMDHIISDAASLGIVWREVLAMYVRSVRGLSCTLPDVPVQFPDYAVWQHRTNESWTKRHGAYWTKRLDGAKRVRPLEDDAIPETGRVRWRRQSLRLVESLSERLRMLCRERKTSTAMVTLATYSAFLLRWTGLTDLVIAFIALGRSDAKVESTIGYFGTSLFLRVQIVAGDSFFDLLERVTDEYCRAYENSDCGRVAAEMPTPGFAWNPRFNWVPEQLRIGDCSDLEGVDSESGLKVEPCRLEVLVREDIDWEGELEMEVYEGKDGVTGFLSYRADRFAALSIERFVRSFEAFAEQLVRQPGAPVPIVKPEGRRLAFDAYGQPRSQWEATT